MKLLLTSSLLFLSTSIFASDAEQGHHVDISPLLFIIMAILLGALTRHYLKRIKLPYTVALLVIGIGVGVLSRLHLFQVWDLGLFNLDGEAIDHALDWAANIDPHLVLYVFLPILIFEAAFGMDVHTFRRTVTNSILLAVPGILIALGLTALLVFVIYDQGWGLHGWDWTMALLLGTVISATDPVAVVSILKELGASKKLGTLIEGESLLNDGTAIVIFMVLFLGVTGVGLEHSPLLEFFRVAIGGIVVGLVMGYVSLRWIKKVFNDALVEISVIVGTAYLTFFLCETAFHVSGVLGLVALGLVMAGRGKTRISPEVQHFLHGFWDFAAFIANTMIFILVGVIIAKRTVFDVNDFIILGVIYIGIHVSRAIALGVLYPIMRKVGYGLPKDHGIVLWWGALRGAIGLAMALIIAGEPSIPMDIRNDFLFLTAGIVTLTLVVNATTMSKLLSKLGITSVPVEKKIAMAEVNNYIRKSSENQLAKLRKERSFRKTNWVSVQSYLSQRGEEVLTHEELNTLAEFRKRILEKEKNSYWQQFENGLLSDVAYQQLTSEINEILDTGGKVPISNRKDLEELLLVKNRFRKFDRIPVIRKFARRLFYDALGRGYDVAKGFVEAQGACLKLLESMERSASEEELKVLDIIEEEIHENIIQGYTFMRNFRKEYPDIFKAVSTKQAIRSILNHERNTITRLYKKGRISKGEADKLTTSVEERMKKLMNEPPKVSLPTPDEILIGIDWLNNISYNEFKQVRDIFRNKVYSVGDKLVTEGEEVHEFLIIARGTVKVESHGEDVELLGTGSSIGELELVTGQKRRSASVIAQTPVTVLYAKGDDFLKRMTDIPQICENIWNIASGRIAMNTLKEESKFSGYSYGKLKKLINTGKMKVMKDTTLLNCDNHIVVLLEGSGNIGGNNISPYSVMDSGNVEFSPGTRIYLIPVKEVGLGKEKIFAAKK